MLQQATIISYRYWSTLHYYSKMPFIQSISKSGRHIRTKSKEFLRNRTNRNPSDSRAEGKGVSCFPYSTASTPSEV